MNQKGLTLVEILITMVIATIVSGLLVVIIVNNAGLFSKETSKLNIGLNTNDALFEIRQSIKEANSVAPSFTDGFTTYTSAANQLVLKISSIDSSNNIIANTFDYFVFFLDTNKLRFKTFPTLPSARKAQDQIFSTSVDSLSFTYLDRANPPNEVAPNAAAKVLVSLTLRQKSGANYETQTATSEANLRND